MEASETKVSHSGHQASEDVKSIQPNMPGMALRPDIESNRSCTKEAADGARLAG